MTADPSTGDVYILDTGKDSYYKNSIIKIEMMKRANNQEEGWRGDPEPDQIHLSPEKKLSRQEILALMGGKASEEKDPSAALKLRTAFTLARWGAVRQGAITALAKRGIKDET